MLNFIFSPVTPR